MAGVFNLNFTEGSDERKAPFTIAVADMERMTWATHMNEMLHSLHTGAGAVAHFTYQRGALTAWRIINSYTARKHIKAWKQENAFRFVNPPADPEDAD